MIRTFLRPVCLLSGVARNRARAIFAAPKWRGSFSAMTTLPPSSKGPGSFSSLAPYRPAGILLSGNDPSDHFADCARCSCRTIRARMVTHLYRLGRGGSRANIWITLRGLGEKVYDFIQSLCARAATTTTDLLGFHLGRPDTRSVRVGSNPVWDVFCRQRSR